MIFNILSSPYNKYNLYSRKSKFLSTIVLVLFLFVECFFILPYDEGFLRKVVYFFFTLIFTIFLMQIRQWMVKAFIVISLLVSLFVYPVYQVYGQIDITYMENAFFTTPDEVISYIKIVPINVLIILFCLIITGIWLLKKDFYQFKSRKLVYTLAVLLSISPAKKVWNGNVKYKQDYSNIPVFRHLLVIIPYQWEVYENYSFIQKELKKNDTWNIISQDETKMKHNMVVIIGESVRKDMLHAYGFPIQNTPFIESSDNVKLENYISAGSHTIVSLRPTLSVSDEHFNYQLNNNLITLGNKLGYETHWISNQKAMGKFDSPIAAIGQKSKYFQFFDSKIQDEELALFLKKALENNPDKPKLIVLHMAGSHPTICDITNGKYDEYIISDEISCYNKTIKNLDNLLKNVYHSLSAQKQSFAMVYFSDHGLKLTPYMNLLHGYEQENYNVPFLLWADDINQKQSIKAQRSGADFLHFFTEYIGVKTKNIQRNYHFLSEKNVGEIQIILKSEELGDYKSLKFHPIPIKK